MKIKELLKTKETWIQGVDAVDEDGVPTDPKDRTAVKWDLMGAFFKCYVGQPGYHDALSKLTEHIDLEDVRGWNDNHSYADLKMILVKMNI